MKGRCLTIYLKDDDEASVELLVDELATYLDTAVGRPDTEEDELPYLLAVEEIEIPDDITDFVRFITATAYTVVMPRPRLHDDLPSADSV